jgi:hypothetical protein
LNCLFEEIIMTLRPFLLASLLFTLSYSYATEMSSMLAADKTPASVPAVNVLPVTPDAVPALDRMGLDRASVHLQILQQSVPHFNGGCNNKKPKNTAASKAS